MRIRTSILVLAAALFAVIFVTRAAQTGPTGKELYVVAHVDAIPPSAQPALALLRKEAADSKADPGFERYEVLQEAARQNHYTLVEVWRSQSDFDHYVATSHCKAFREKLLPMLGSPFDERFHTIVR
jgi:quinol monooxygenase YgiN